MNDFDGLVAVVTGGASGIGAATAEHLRDRGARVAVLDRIYTSVNRSAVLEVPCDVADAEVRARGHRYSGRLARRHRHPGQQRRDRRDRRCDPERRRGMASSPERQRRRHRPGEPRSDPVPAPVRTRSHRQHLLGSREYRRPAARAVLGQQGRGAGADAGDGCRLRQAASGSTRVTPGTADTPWVRRLLDQAPDAEAAAAALRARQPMGRLVTAEEIAWAIAYLAGPMSGSTTGTMLAVDGGMAGIRVG